MKYRSKKWAEEIYSRFASKSGCALTFFNLHMGIKKDRLLEYLVFGEDAKWYLYKKAISIMKKVILVDKLTDEHWIDGNTQSQDMCMWAYNHAFELYKPRKYTKKGLFA